jgi:hypothetical protein
LIPWSYSSPAVLAQYPILEASHPDYSTSFAGSSSQKHTNVWKRSPKKLCHLTCSYIIIIYI